MTTPDSKRSLADSLRAMQEAAQKAGPAATASYSLIGGIVLLGGIGYAVDEWLGTSPWFLFGGLLLALVYGFFQLAMMVFRR